MRAICEACSAAQPAAWRAGDLCAQCGRAVRRELRCFWCAKWTPAATFCRSCGAACVESAQYGAARMLKDAGADRFRVPQLLGELEPDQIENFTRIYQRQAALAARHVEDLQLVERELQRHDFSVMLEEQLAAQLPWDEATLQRMRLHPRLHASEFDMICAVEAQTPFEITRALAPLARLLQLDARAWGSSRALLRHHEPAVREAAAFALSSWRVLARHGIGNGDQSLLVELLEHSTLRAEAQLRLAAITGEALEIGWAAQGELDPEREFQLALVRGERDRLAAALREDDLRCIAAGRVLIELGETALLEHALLDRSAQVQASLVAALAAARKPAPSCNQALLQLLERSADEALREDAARVLCRALPPGSGLRLARAARGNTSILQSLFQLAQLPPDELSEVLALLAEQGQFQANMYGVHDLLERGQLRPDAVPRAFARANHDARKQLCLLAGEQLRRASNPGLARFLMRIVHGEHPPDLRVSAYLALQRWHRERTKHLRDASELPLLALQPALLAQFFGSTAEFLPRLRAQLRDRGVLQEVSLSDHLYQLLGSHDAAFVAECWAEPRATAELVTTLLDVFEAAEPHPFLRGAALKLVIALRDHSHWRNEVNQRLQRARHAHRDAFPTDLRLLLAHFLDA